MEHLPDTGLGKEGLFAMGSRDAAVPAAIGAMVGGGLLAAGSLMTWSTSSTDLDAVAKVLGDSLGIPVDPATLPRIGILPSISARGTTSTAGRLTLILGLLVVVFGIVSIVVRNARSAMSVLVLVCGVAGGGIALGNILTKDHQVEDALSTFATQLARAGSPVDVGRLNDAVGLSLGTGIWLCVAGGVLAAIASILSLLSKTAEPARAGTSVDGGFGFVAAIDAPSSPAPRSTPATEAPARPSPHPPDGAPPV
jgi:hypothetical protein